MKLSAVALFAAVCAGWVPLVVAQDVVPAAPVQQEERAVFPASVPQGALVFGRVPPGSQVRYRERLLRATGYGTVALGVGRDETGPLKVDITLPSGRVEPVSIAVTPRDWPVEHVNGVPPKTVHPPPEIGRFGNARVYNGQPGAGHSGMDIAAPTGTPVKAPAGGLVTFAAPDLYLTGGTVLLDHGHGVSSNFLHLARIDVKVGDRVEPGQSIGAVGATGRATGPHLHWGMNWFDVRIDPLLVLERGK